MDVEQHIEQQAHTYNAEHIKQHIDYWAHLATLIEHIEHHLLSNTE